MAFSPNQPPDCDDEANQALAEVNLSEEWVVSYPNLTMSPLTSPSDTHALGWAADATIDPALLTRGYVSSDISAYNAYMQRP